MILQNNLNYKNSLDNTKIYHFNETRHNCCKKDWRTISSYIFNEKFSSSVIELPP